MVSCMLSSYSIAAVMNILILIYGALSLFFNYSEVRFVYYVLAVLFFAFADVYAEMGRRIGAITFHVTSILLAFKAVL
jgi:uncharacterized membrane protein (UPF0136 family)